MVKAKNTFEQVLGCNILLSFMVNLLLYLVKFFYFAAIIMQINFYLVLYQKLYNLVDFMSIESYNESSSNILGFKRHEVFVKD